MNLVPPQTDSAELLDLGHGTVKQVRQSLHDIARMNRWLGGNAIIQEGVFAMLTDVGATHASVLDVGTGSADLPVALGRAAKRCGLALSFVALDISARHLQVASEDVGSESGIKLLQGNAFRLPFPDNAVDVVTASLFLHHFRPPEIGEILGEFSRVARRGWVIGDIVRHNVPLVFLRCTHPIFARSYLTRYDANASIRRAYTVPEMRAIMQEHNLTNVQVRAHFPFRMSLRWRK